MKKLFTRWNWRSAVLLASLPATAVVIFALLPDKSWELIGPTMLSAVLGGAIALFVIEIVWQRQVRIEAAGAFESELERLVGFTHLFIGTLAMALEKERANPLAAIDEKITELRRCQSAWERAAQTIGPLIGPTGGSAMASIGRELSEWDLLAHSGGLTPAGQLTIAWKSALTIRKAIKQLPDLRILRESEEVFGPIVDGWLNRLGVIVKEEEQRFRNRQRKPPASAESGDEGRE